MVLKHYNKVDNYNSKGHNFPQLKADFKARTTVNLALKSGVFAFLIGENYVKTQQNPEKF